ARPALTFEIAARNAARGIEFLKVIAGEREEVDPLLGLLAGNHGRQQLAFTIGGDDRAVGLAGDLAAFEDELAPSPVKFNTMDIEHCDLSWISRRAKAMRKTARGCLLQSCRNSKQHPAILPWLSNFRVATGDNRPVSNWQQ